LQVAQTSKRVQRVESAAAVLKDAAKRSGDERLMALASDLAPFKSVKGRFDPIISAIKKMIAILKSQEQKDLDTKQTCEADRMANTRTAIDTSRKMDEQTDKITTLAAHIAKCEAEIKDLQADQKKVADALSKASQMRKDENTEWKENDNDDKLAAETVRKARDVIANWYADNKVFVQVVKQPVSGMKAGEAPPPPPTTWESDYEGNQGESQGIVAIMEMVEADIKKDRADAKADEDAAQKEFDNFKKDSEKKIGELKAEEEATSKAKGKAQQEKSDTEKGRTSNKKALRSTLATIKSIDPNCEYYEVNYPMRRKNRQIEIDGLNKAMAILKGGAFDSGPDPNREIKPGDAL